jgi:hypothetical protein
MLQPPTPRFSLLTAIACVSIAWLMLSWPWLAGKVRIPWDAPAHFQPQFSFLAASLGSNQSPFWAPQVFAGHPQIADPQSLIFSPPFFLAALLGPSPGLGMMDGMLFVFLLVGSLFILLFFRDKGWHEAGAIVAAMSFAFGGSAAWRIQHVGQVTSLAWFPIALWLLDRALRRGSAGYGLAAGFAAGFMLLGRDQVAFLGLVMLGIYALVQLTDKGMTNRKAIIPLSAGAIGGFITIAIPMAMTLLNAADSNRPMISLSEAGKGSLQPWSLLTALIPHLFGIARPLSEYWGPPSPDWGWVDLYLARNMATLYFGLLPLLGIILLPFLSNFRNRIVMSPTDLAAGRDPHRREGLFLTLSFIAMILYSLGRYTPFFGAVFSILPGIDKFRRPADALFLACTFGSMAGGYGIHRWMSAPRFVLPCWANIALPALAFFCWFAGATLAWQVGRFEQTLAPLAAGICFFFAAIITLILLRRMAEKGASASRLAPMAIVSLFMLVDLGWNNAPNESTGLNPEMFDVLRPDTANETIAILKQRVASTRADDRIDRVELAGVGFHWPNATLTHNLHHTLGYNPVRSSVYSRSVGARDHIAGPDQRLFTPLFSSYKSLMADMVGLRFIASSIPMQELYNAAPRQDLPAKDLSIPKFDPEDFPLVARTGDGYIYENPRALPRVLFAANAIKVDFEDLIKTGVWPDFNPRDTVLLKTEIPTERNVPGLKIEGERTAKIVSYKNTEVIIEAESSSGGYVVLNDSYQEWWRVEVNDKPAVLEQANVAFRAVLVPPGKNKVRFIFRPFSGALAEILNWR